MGKTAWRKIFSKGFLYVALILNAVPLMAGSRESEDFGREFTSTLFTIKDLFSQQDDGAQDLGSLIKISIAGALVVILAFLAERLTVRLYWKHSIKNHKAAFETVVEQVKDTALEGLSKEENAEFLDKCQEISLRTDFYTVRPGNTYIASPIVYRIAKGAKCTPEECALYFYAALVYDCGFLEFDPEIFRMEILNRKEKLRFKKHVIGFEDHIEFLPKKIYEICSAACYLHHENMDGTGYPESLKESQIPLVARIIRVADSYTSLITKRTYHHRLTPKQAVQDLKRKSKIYDQKLVDILQSIV